MQNALSLISFLAKSNHLYYVFFDQVDLVPGRRKGKRILLFLWKYNITLFIYFVLIKTSEKLKEMFVDISPLSMQGVGRMKRELSGGEVDLVCTDNQADEYLREIQHNDITRSQLTNSSRHE